MRGTLGRRRSANWQIYGGPSTPIMMTEVESNTESRVSKFDIVCIGIIEQALYHRPIGF